MIGVIGTSDGFCAHTANIFQIVGLFLLVFKIVIPIILIVLGMVDLGKAVIATDDKQIKSSVNTMIKRFIAAIVIFFVPTIVSSIFSLVQGFQDNKEDYDVCKTCITRPNESKEDKTGCKDYISKYTN